MSTPKPKLVAVETPSAEQPSEPPPLVQPSPPSRWIRLALIVTLIAAASAAVWQTQRVEVLLGQVEGLQVELGEAQAALGAYQHRFGEIRASVGGLRAQFGELEALVETPPASPSTP